MQLLGIGAKRNLAEGLGMLRRAAAAGKFQMSAAGMRCESRRDYEAARAVYEMGAATKDVIAMSKLGRMYNRGVGGPVDHDKAFPLIKAAAEGGFLNAFDDLAWHYQAGKGTPKNPEEAFKWLNKSADMAKMRRTNVPLCRLGLAYMKGTGTAVNTAKGLDLINKAAADGCSEARNALGMIYGQGLYGIPKDLAVSASWYKKVVDASVNFQRESGLPPFLNDRVAFYRYALCMRNGWGVPKDLPGSVKYLRVAAAKGPQSYDEDDLADAQTQLGIAYKDGIGVQVDLAEAFKCFQAAAKQNHAEGLRNLSWMYREGKGVAKDVAEADKLLKKAEEQARQDDADALNDLPPPPLERDMTF
jgi:TPR repeat protein